MASGAPPWAHAVLPRQQDTWRTPACATPPGPATRTIVSGLNAVAIARTIRQRSGILRGGSVGRVGIPLTNLLGQNQRVNTIKIVT